MLKKWQAIIGPLLISLGLAGLVRTLVVGREAALLIYLALAVLGVALTWRTLRTTQKS